MRTVIWSAAVFVAMAGIALAQAEAGGGVYLLDVDPARYAGPAGQRVILRVGDQPRHFIIGGQEEICVQLERLAGESEIISARIRSLGPDPKAAEVRVVAPDISPGTYRSTPWGMLLRALPGETEPDEVIAAVRGTDAPVCAI